MISTNVPWVGASVLYVSLVSTFLLYGHHTFYRDPGSMFFDKSRAFERMYSAYRQAEVERFQQAASQGIADNLRARNSASICASFVSVKRQGAQYLPLAVASALHGLSACERQDLYVNVLIAHTNTTQHPSSSIEWLADVVDDLHGYNLTLEQLERLQQLEFDNEFTTKAVQDYTRALTDCYHTQAEWIIVFEDDILLADGWFAKTKEAIQTIQSRVSHTQKDWLFMRLFNQERSTGWHSRAVGGNHEVLISSLISSLTFAVISICRRRYGRLRKVLDRGSIFVTCVLAIPTFVVLFFQAGKASMLPPRDGVRKEAFGCCSQGLVFPRDRILRITEYLTSREHGQIDLMLNDLAVGDSLNRFALYPVQLQHIGQRSVRGTTSDEAQAIWSMAFETLEPKALQSSHTRSLERLFPSGCTTVP